MDILLKSKSSYGEAKLKHPQISFIVSRSLDQLELASMFVSVSKGKEVLVNKIYIKPIIINTLFLLLSKVINVVER